MNEMSKEIGSRAAKLIVGEDFTTSYEIVFLNKSGNIGKGKHESIGKGTCKLSEVIDTLQRNLHQAPLAMFLSFSNSEGQIALIRDKNMDIYICVSKYLNVVHNVPKELKLTSYTYFKTKNLASGKIEEVKSYVIDRETFFQFCASDYRKTVISHNKFLKSLSTAKSR